MRRRDLPATGFHDSPMFVSGGVPIHRLAEKATIWEYMLSSASVRRTGHDRRLLILVGRHQVYREAYPSLARVTTAAFHCPMMPLPSKRVRHPDLLECSRQQNSWHRGCRVTAEDLKSSRGRTSFRDVHNQKLQAEHAGPEVLVTLTSPFANDGSSNRRLPSTVGWYGALHVRGQCLKPIPAVVVSGNFWNLASIVLPILS